jgi:iron complex transport system substrate-binding protein
MRVLTISGQMILAEAASRSIPNAFSSEPQKPTTGFTPATIRSLSELFNADPRFAKFGAAQISQVFNNTRQVSKNGGNNIWERGIVHPEEVLADLIKIFHPDLLPEHELIYYENLQ